jgi:hypothetical protein
MSDGGNAPSWLFSFVDLAFLLLIAMTQLAQDTSGPDLGDIIVPRIEQSATAPPNADANPPWQLRIHPPDPEAVTPPFELVQIGTPEAEAPPRLTLSELHARLAQVKMTGLAKPLLAPHEDSRSQDLLDGVAALEAQWPGRRRAVVAPLMANR